jgi:hypothetical protein
VLWLVGQLPPDSAFGASVRGGAEYRAWSPQMHLLAGIANLLNAANRQRAGKKTREALIKPPTAKKQPRVLSVAEIARRQQQSAAEAHTQTMSPEVIE